MAVTIQTSINDVMALQQPFVLTASSTKTGQPKMRFVMTVEVDGVQEIKVKQQPNQNDYVHFDLYRILKTYLSPKFEESSEDIHEILTACSGDDISRYIEIDIYEEYSTSSTTNPTEYPADGDSVNFITFNSTFQFTDGVTPTLPNVYEFNNDATEISWLSKMPTILKTRAGEYQSAAILASAFEGTVDSALRVKYTFFEADGTQISTTNVTRLTIGMEEFISTKSTVNAPKLFQFIPVGYQNLEDQSFNANVKPSANANLSYYTVQVFDNSVNPYNTKTYRFDVADCYKYTPVQLAWVNELGSWDYYTFELASIEKLNIQRDTIRKAYGNWASAAAFSYEKYERGEDVIKIEADKEYTVNSDWLEDSDFVWLQSLLMSKEVQVYLEDEWLPVIITDNNYQFKKSVNNKLNQLSLSYKLSHKTR